VLYARYDLAGAAAAMTREALAARPFTLWRYHEVLPVRDPANVVTLGEGGTPLLPMARFGGEIGVAHLFAKDEGLNPTGSFKARGWFDVSTLKEPYRAEGKKTMGFELAEQFGWSLPEVIVYPTGGGTGIVGMWKAFAELEAMGLIGPERPRMVCVQSDGCAPIV